MTVVKICGLTRAEDALAAARAGADFLGFVFVPASPRFISPEAASRIVRQVRDAGHQRARAVGVFRDASVSIVRHVAQQAELDLLQFHGTEPDSLVRELAIESIRAIPVNGSLPNVDTTAEWLLFDSANGGGSGVRFDWSLLAERRPSKPFFLAGGITPMNAPDAIAAVAPDAVDCSSGVERSPGIKDAAAMSRLIEAVKR